MFFVRVPKYDHNLKYLLWRLPFLVWFTKLLLAHYIILFIKNTIIYYSLNNKCIEIVSSFKYVVI